MSKRLVRAGALAAVLTSAVGLDVAPGLAQTPPPAQTPPQAQTPPVQTPQAPLPSPSSQAGAPPAALAAPVMKLTFQEAVDRAMQRNPSVAQATSDILRADALLRQARAVLFPTLNGTLQDTVASQIIEFDGQPISPRNSFNAQLPVTLPLSAVSWARRNQAADNKVTAERAQTDVKRQIAQSAAQAYLAVIVQRRLLDTAVSARDTAQAHYDLAHQQQVAGAGSRLNELRAQQDLSTDEVSLQNAQIAVYQAQEALGVLVAADGAVDASEEPMLDLPPDASSSPATQVDSRTDLRLAVAQEMAARRVLNDSWKDRMPTFQVQFTPQYLNPSTLFSPAWTSNTIFSSTLPIFDGGLRAAQKVERQALLEQAQSAIEAVRRQAASEIRAAAEAVKSAERSVAAAHAAADQAHQVVNITNIAFRAGASTNIEVIDAQRAARDADISAAVEEDRLRRAKLDLLVATGRFPQQQP